MTTPCIFCNPDPAAVVYSGEDGLVLIDGPCRPGHVLVGVRGHHPDLQDVPDAELAAMSQLARRVAQGIVRTTGAVKTYVIAIGDKDRHFHVHLVPKMANDPSLGPYMFGPPGWAAFLPSEPDPKAVADIAEKLRSGLRGAK